MLQFLRNPLIHIKIIGANMSSANLQNTRSIYNKNFISTHYQQTMQNEILFKIISKIMKIFRNTFNKL